MGYSSQPGKNSARPSLRACLWVRAAPRINTGWGRRGFRAALPRRDSNARSSQFLICYLVNWSVAWVLHHNRKVKSSEYLWNKKEKMTLWGFPKSECLQFRYSTLRKSSWVPLWSVKTPLLKCTKLSLFKEGLWDQMNANQPLLALIDYTLMSFSRSQAGNSDAKTHALDT